MKVSRVTQNTRIWCATGIIRRGTIELIVRDSKKQLDANVAELAERDEDKCDVLSVIDKSIGNKNR